MGGEMATFNAGLWLPATIGDTVWYDSEPNGIEDGDEVPYDIPVTIVLYDALGNAVGETLSDENGIYSFTNVRPGNYSLEFILDDDRSFAENITENNTELDVDLGPTTGEASVTLTNGNDGADAGDWGAGLYYPDWINDVQVRWYKYNVSYVDSTEAKAEYLIFYLFSITGLH
jgi:hypothetical protein